MDARIHDHVEDTHTHKKKKKKKKQNFLVAGSPQLSWHKTMRIEGIAIWANAYERKNTQVEDTHAAQRTTNTSKLQVTAALTRPPHHTNVP